MSGKLNAYAILAADLAESVANRLRGHAVNAGAPSAYILILRKPACAYTQHNPYQIAYDGHKELRMRAVAVQCENRVPDLGLDAMNQN